MQHIDAKVKSFPVDTYPIDTTPQLFEVGRMIQQRYFALVSLVAEAPPMIDKTMLFTILCPPPLAPEETKKIEDKTAQVAKYDQALATSMAWSTSMTLRQVLCREESIRPILKAKIDELLEVVCNMVLTQCKTRTIFKTNITAKTNIVLSLEKLHEATKKELY